MTKSPFIVYILPIILSVSLGTIVMAEALNDSERELNMWQFDGNIASTEQELSLIGLEKSYSVSELIEFSIKVNDESFNCGDLYITIYKTNPVNQVVTQSGYLKQCFAINQQNLPIDENVIDDPITTYDFHKLQAERWLKFYSKQGWVQGVSLRLTNVFGPGPKNSSSDRGILNMMIKKALKGEKLSIYGKGDYIRDYIYIDDVISAFISTAFNINKMRNKHFVLGSGIGTTIKDAIESIAKYVNNNKTVVEHIQTPTDLSLIESRDFIADITAISNSSGWSPNVDFLDGIDLTIKLNK